MGKNNRNSRASKLNVSATEPVTKNKFVRFITNKNFLLGAAAFLLPALVLYIVFIMNGVHPFGNKQVLVTDLWHQYYPFLCTLQEKLKAGESLLYSETIGMGINFWALIAYYCASPLNFLVGLVSKESLRDLVAVLIVLKVGFSGLFFSMYLKKVNKRYDFSTIVFSALYALCGYVLGYYWNIMWLDCVALLPLVMMGVYSLIKENKCVLYIVSLAIAVISNFYIGFMLCIFTAIYFFSECFKESMKLKEFAKKLGLIALSSVVALALTAFMTVPAYFALNNTVSSEPKAATQSADDESDGNAMLDALGAAGKEFAKDAPSVASRFLSFNEPVPKDGLPNAFSGFISIILLGYFLCSKKIGWREKLSTSIVILIMFLSMTLKGIDLIWHGMHTPNMVPYRYAFIVSFVLISMAYRVYVADIGTENIVQIRKRNTGGVTVSLLISLVVVLCAFNKNVTNSLVAFIQDGTPIKDTAIATILGCLALSVVYYVIIESISLEKNTTMRKVWATMLCGVVLLEVVINTIIAVPTVRTTDYTTYYWRGEEIEKLLDKVDADSSYGRVETSQEYILNDPALYGYKGVSTFTSTANVNVTRLMEKLAICGLPRSNRYYYETTSPLTNAFLGVERVIFKNDMTNLNPYLEEEAYVYYDSKPERRVFEMWDNLFAENRALAEKFPVIDYAVNMYLENNNASRSRQVMYKNNQALPIGFMTDDALLGEDALAGANPFEIQNSLFRAATGLEGDLFTEIPLKNVPATNTIVVRGSGGRYSLALDEGETTYSLGINYEMPNEESVYAYIDGKSISKVAVKDTSYKVDARKYIFPAGNFATGETVCFKFTMADSYKDSASIKFMVYYMDEDLFEEGMELLRDESFEIKRYDSTVVEGTINALEDGVFYTSIPYEKGWTLYVDGSKTEITPFENAMICVPLNEGEHSIKLVYSPQGFKAGVIISSVTAVAFAAMLVTIIWRRKKRGQNIDSSTVL